MQYAQLKQVIEIDDQITNLHQELSSLYAQRTLFMGTSRSSKQAGSRILDQTLTDPWVIQTYSYLASAWAVHNMTIPPITDIEKKLLKARKIIENLLRTDPEVGYKMTVLLVPPTIMLPFPVPAKMRQKQKHIILDDYIDKDLLATTKIPKKSWQVFVAYSGLVGVDYGSAAKIVKYKKYVTNGYDLSAMGLRQYAALSLQLNKAIDQNVWTVLLSQKLSTTVMVPSVTFLNGQYRFELDEPNSILGDERFRPAIEVKG